jgi:O-succinylhomoserine sulfhydrylase
LLKGLETLSLRVEKQSDNAKELALWLEQCDMVEKVNIQSCYLTLNMN